jgi:hypothetical protein
MGGRRISTDSMAIGIRNFPALIGEVSCSLGWRCNSVSMSASSWIETATTFTFADITKAQAFAYSPATSI